MSTKTLLVGCGGSGITTLLRFNELLAGNSEWRKNLWENVSYMVIDTEIAKINQFREQVAAQCGRARMPVMKLVQITRGYQTLDEIVAPHITPRRGTPEGDLLARHWWMTTPLTKDQVSEPYRAQYIHPIDVGAGQCGPVSYLAAWKYLPRLEHDVDEILSEIETHNIGESNPLANLRVFIVAGLAGGTGRGTWNLIAFKLRQYLQKRHHKVEPASVFFDAKCFETVLAGQPDQLLGTKVNSLTGVSELASWMRIRDTGEFRYHLPNLENPDLTGDTDVIRVPDDEDDPTQLSPIAAAYLVFAKNGSGSLSSNRQYHEMAAAALYAMVVGAQYIDAGAINRLSGFGSFAATSFEVDTVKLRAFFEATVRETAIDALRELAGPENNFRREAETAVGFGADASRKSFLKRTNFFVSDAVTTDVLVGDADANAPIVQQIVSALRREYGDGAETFANHVEAQDVEETKRFALEMFDVGSEEDAAVQLDAVLSKYGLDEKTMAITLREAVKSAYVVNGRPSAGRALAAINALTDQFEESRNNLQKPVSDPSGVSIDGVDMLKERFVSFVDEKAKRKFLEFKPFMPDEKDALKLEYSNYLGIALFFRIRDLLVERFRSAEQILAKLHGSFTMLVDSLAETAKEFGRQAHDASGAAKGVTAYEQLFVDGNSTDAVRKSIPRADSTQNIYRRVLKPIMSKEMIATLLRKNESVVCHNDELETCVNLALDDILSLPEDRSRDELRAKLRKTFVSKFREHVFLERTFMDRVFTFERVLANNIPYWNKLLAATNGEPDHFDTLTDDLRVWLGLSISDFYESEDDTVPHIREDGLMRNILVSMVGTCKPWVELRQADGTYLTTLALVPKELDEDDVKEYASAAQKKHPTQAVQIIHRKDTANGGEKLPLDRIVVFAAQDIKGETPDEVLNSVLSLDYWQEADVKKMLELAEDADGAAFWKKDARNGKYGERQRGLGFVSPVFVRDETLSSLRWRPWKPEKTVSQSEAEKNAVIDVLLYAFLGQGMPADATQLAELEASFGWKLPLVQMGFNKTEDFNYTREPIMWKDGRGQLSPIPKWSAGAPLIYSIDNVFAYLRGEGRPGDEGKALAKSQAEGREQLAQMQEERSAFLQHVVATIGGAAYTTLVAARQTWLIQKKRDASAEDKPFWDLLIARSAEELA